ncbi:MAG: PrsW family intramembrane metalloprotease, partial [Thermoflexales bacterium]|nr:PrsW family intramembrane metalloprotease [Thermoflexales bacterium]
FNNVLVALVGGLAAFGAAHTVNTAVVNRGVSFQAVTTTTAPIAEELLKSIALLFLVGRPNFTYFVDGAIYGFAAGTAFAVMENPYYAIAIPGSGGIGTMLMRAFSTSLMHGTASALVGVALGRFRFARGGSRGLSLLAGWGSAIALHAGFNRAVYHQVGGIALPLALGLGGVILVVSFIFWGLREEKSWLEEKLGMDQLRVTKGEKGIVLKMEDLDKLLEPIQATFGEEKRDQVEAFVRYQAQLGIKRKAAELARDEKLRGELQKQIDEMQLKMDALRRQVGAYCMSYVRFILPLEGLMYAMIAERIKEMQDRPPSDKDLWRDVAGRAEGEKEAKTSMFDRISRE